MNYQGDFTTANTVYLFFNTFDSNDPSASVAIAAFVLADIEVFKDGSATARTSTSGFALLDTDGIDFSGDVGIGGISIDLSDDTHAGFFAVGSEYMVKIGPVTIDAAVINFVAGSFSIERSGGVLALLKGTNSLADIEGKIDTLDTVADGIQTDLSNGTDGLGALKTLVDTVNTDLSNGTDGLGAIKAVVDVLATTSDLLDKLGAVNEAAAAGDPSSTESVMQYVKQIVNILTGSAGIVTMPAAAAPGNAVSIAEMIRAIYDDTNELQADDIPTTLGTLATTADLLDKLGAVNEAAAAGDPSATESVMQYVKQIVNILAGADGVTTMPAAAAPGNNVSITEMIRAIYDDTNELQVDDYPTTIAAVQTVVDDVQTQVGTAGAGLTDLGGMSTSMKAEVNTEVDGGLDTAISELSVAAPTATPTLRTGLMLLYMALRNKTVVQTSGTDALEIYNNAGTKIAAKLLTDAAGDYTEAEMA